MSPDSTDSSHRRLVAASLLALAAVGSALRAAVAAQYEPSLDWGAVLNWARRMALADGLGPLGTVLARGHRALSKLKKLMNPENNTQAKTA